MLVLTDVHILHVKYLSMVYIAKLQSYLLLYLKRLCMLLVLHVYACSCFLFSCFLEDFCNHMLLCSQAVQLRGVGSGPAGPVLAGPLFIKVNTKFHSAKIK